MDAIQLTQLLNILITANVATEAIVTALFAVMNQQEPADSDYWYFYLPQDENNYEPMHLVNVIVRICNYVPRAWVSEFVTGKRILSVEYNDAQTLNQMFCAFNVKYVKCEPIPF